MLFSHDLTLDPTVTWAAVIVIIILVQGVQFFANWLARKVLRR